MADKKDEIPIQYLDRRVVERYIKRGLLDEKEYARHLKALEDLAEQAGRWRRSSPRTASWAPRVQCCSRSSWPAWPPSPRGRAPRGGRR